MLSPQIIAQRTRMPTPAGEQKFGVGALPPAIK
jgi:hypothetical protein